MRRRGSLVAACTAVVATLIASPSVAAGERATVFAGSSLAEVLPRIDPTARLSLGSSAQLAQQIRLGAPTDVFLSASAVYTQALHQEGLVRRPVPFATNALVLIVPRANPARIAAVHDLARRPKLKLVVSAPAVPIGLYTREVLKRLGLLSLLRKTVSLEPDVKGIVGKVALGEADAGFVYATDVRSVRTKVTVIRLPATAQPEVTYEAALAIRPTNPEAAEAFMRALLGRQGQAALRAAGFGAPQ